ncbi:hypothetical protein FRB95_002363 [Tulasnella sp. JGI-2019a]|nr:hypothetical protein FRB95_002363 [Tulasnella sp. JGI-2019a]
MNAEDHPLGGSPPLRQARAQHQAATTTTTAPLSHKQMIIQREGEKHPASPFDFSNTTAAAGDTFQMAVITPNSANGNARPMKPLPRSKRRRTGEGIPGGSDDGGGSDVGILNGVNGGHAVLGSFPMQLQYYPPVTGGTPSPGAFGTTALFGHISFATDGGGDDGGMMSDGDDHRREERDHQGNTKKRKVPAAAHHHFRNGSSGEDDVDAVAVTGGENGERGGDADERYGRDDFDSEPRTLDVHHSTSSAAVATSALADTGSGSATATMGSKQRLPPATMNHVRTKEIIRKRRRLMAGILTPNTSVINTASEADDETAILLALSDATLNWNLRGPDSTTKPLMDSRTREKRRKIAALSRRSRKHSLDAVEGWAIPEGTGFNLVFPSPASDRMRKLSDEVASYRDRFQVELARLATAKRIAENASPTPSGGVDAKRGQIGSRKKLTTTTTTTINGNTTTTTTTYTKSGANPGLGMNDVNGHHLINGNGKAVNGVNGNGKKNRKRTTNSKSSDPHRTGNYIPSRLPTAAGVPPTLTPAQAAASIAALVSPLPVRFLSADVPDTPSQRRRRRNINPKTNQPYITSSLPPVQPELEWICPFCEYDLFFGGEERWRKAVRARKKLLSRRRRARERAAMAASGQSTRGTLKKKHGGEDEGEEEEEDILNQEAKFEDPEAVEARVNANVRSVLKDKDKDRDKGGGLEAGGANGVGIAV